MDKDMDIDMEHQMKDDVEEEVGDDDDDDEQQQQRQRRVSELEPKVLDYYPGGPHDTTMLNGYHVHVARMVADGEVR